MAAQSSEGTRISVDGGSTYVAQVTGMSGASPTFATVETSDFSSATKTYIAGLEDGGDCSFDISYDPADLTHIVLEGLVGGAEQDIKIEWGDIAGPENMTFKGIITGFSANAAIDGILTATVNIKVSGTVTF